MLEAEYLEAKKTTSFETKDEKSFYVDVGQWKGFTKDTKKSKIS